MYPDPQPFEFREVNSGEIRDQIKNLIPEWPHQ